MKNLLFLLLFLTSFFAIGQKIENTEVIHKEAITIKTDSLARGYSIIDIGLTGDSVGGLRMSPMTQAQIDALSPSSADSTLIVYNGTDSTYQYWDGNSWEVFGGGGGDNIYTADGTLSGDRVVSLNENQLSFNLGTSATRLVDKGVLIDASGINHGSPNTLVFDVKNPNRSILYITHVGELISTSESSLIANLRNSSNNKGLYLDQTSSTFRGTSLNFSFEGNSSQPYVLNTNISSSSQLRWYRNSTTLDHTIKSSSNSEVIFYENGFSTAGFVIGSGAKVGSENISLQGSTLIKGTGSTSATTSLEIQNSSGSVSFKTLDDLTVVMPNLPTSSAGLPSGALWNNLGIVNVVP